MLPTEACYHSILPCLGLVYPAQKRLRVVNEAHDSPPFRKGTIKLRKRGCPRSAQELLDVLDSLKFSLLVRHHSKGASAVSCQSNIASQPVQDDSHELLPLLYPQHALLHAPFHDEAVYLDLVILT